MISFLRVFIVAYIYIHACVDAYPYMCIYMYVLPISKGFADNVAVAGGTHRKIEYIPVKCYACSPDPDSLR